MQTIHDINFKSGTLPENWIDEARESTFKSNILHSGRKSAPSFILPGNGWHKLKIEITAQTEESSVIEFGNGRTSLLIDFHSGIHSVHTHGAATLYSNKCPITSEENLHSIIFEFDHGKWTAKVDSQMVISFPDPQQISIAGWAQLTFWSNCSVHNILIQADDPLEKSLYSYSPRDENDDFHLEMTVDFPDDLYYAPYTLEMLDQLFAEYASWGVRRCHWIYDGLEKDNWWCHFMEPTYQNYLKTLENFGGDIFETAVKMAHKHGIEIYGIFKPFEMAYMLNTYGEGTEKAKQLGRFSRIGGVISRCPDYVIEHRELTTKRKPGNFGPSTNKTFTRIDLVAEDDAPIAFKAEDLKIFVSDDNNTYHPYEGPIEYEELIENYPIYELTSSGGRPTDQSRLSRVLRLKNLNIPNNFIAITTPNSSNSFSNTLVNLVHIFGEEGEEFLFTLGTFPRAGEISYDIHSATNTHKLNFSDYGIEFDNVQGSPTACLTAYDRMRERHTLDCRYNFIGIARGKDETAVGVMSPFYLETRQWWLQWVTNILEAGADGVEFRVRNHHSHMSWAEFGFEKPLRDEFLNRYGVDIWETDDFDKCQWRRLRGEAYTQFYREANKLIKAYGKRMGIHISRSMDCDPAFRSTMEIDCDWRTWIDEGLADSVTMKEVWPNSPFAEEILSHTRPKNVPVIFSPFANNIWHLPNGEKVCANRISQAKQGGYDGFQYYENAAIMRAHQGGKLTVEHPELSKTLQKEFTA